jgi:hypothetical protein
MALYNEILTGRYNRALQKIFQLKGGPPAPQLAGEISVTLSMFYGVENRYLEGWNRYAIAAAPGTPAAGNRAAVRIRNAANSNVVGVLERISIFKSVAPGSTPFVLVDSIATTMPTENNANIGARSLDTRQQQTNSNLIVSTSVNFGIVGTSAMFAPCTNLVPFEIVWYENQEICLSPNEQLTVADDVLADALLVSFVWRERPLEEGERT